MGGKGKRRREKNYLVAHGGPTRLPPPPDPSQVDALPSKLRRLMSFTSSSPHASVKFLKATEGRKERGDADVEKKIVSGKEVKPKATVIEDEGDDGPGVSFNHDNSDDENVQNMAGEKKKRKRKMKQIKDLRFEKEMEALAAPSRRQERKKKYWEAKKNKQKKAKTEDTVDFPGREKIQFGEVVEAPLKLVAIPKGRKVAADASKERLRLRAIEAYRSRKGWTSRPGLQFPPPMPT